MDAAGLDPLTVAGGPTSESGPAMSAKFKGGGAGPYGPGDSGSRQAEVADTVLVQGQTGAACVNLEAQGDENALGFSLAFDPAALSFTGATLGSATVLFNNVTP